MPLPFALTLPQLIGALGLGTVATIAAAGGESATMRDIKKQRVKTAAFVGVTGGKPKMKRPKFWPKDKAWPPKQPEGAGEFEFPTGPLPKAARDAYTAKKKGKGRSKSAYGSKNDIHKKDGWFRFATYSKKWDRKHEKLRYYSGPRTGAMYVRKAGASAMVGNLCWMARCPDAWYPGRGKAKSLNIRLPALLPLLGPKADWKTLSNSFKTSIKNIPAVLKAAAVVVAGIYSGGKSVQKNPEGQLKTVGKGIKGAIEPMADAGRESDSRLDASRVIVTAIRKQYILQMMDANPWCVKDGKLDFGKHYMDNPKTWEDLFKPGKSRPLLFNPPVSR